MLCCTYALARRTAVTPTRRAPDICSILPYPTWSSRKRKTLATHHRPTVSNRAFINMSCSPWLLPPSLLNGAMITAIIIELPSIWSRVEAAVFIHDIFELHRQTWPLRLTNPYRTTAINPKSPRLEDPCWLQPIGRFEPPAQSFQLHRSSRRSPPCSTLRHVLPWTHPCKPCTV